MKKVILVTLVFLIISCKNNKGELAKEATEEITEEVTVKKPEKLIVELELKYSESDEIILSSSKVFINNNRTMNLSVIEKVKKSDEFKTIILDFPENIKPDYQIYVNFGNKEEKSIEIKGVKITYGEVSYDVSPQEMNNYFNFNKYIKYNSEKGIMTIKKDNGKLNPLMFFRRKIVVSL